MLIMCFTSNIYNIPNEHKQSSKTTFSKLINDCSYKYNTVKTFVWV